MYQKRKDLQFGMKGVYNSGCSMVVKETFCIMTRTLTWMHGVQSCSGEAKIVINRLVLVVNSIDHSTVSIFCKCNRSLLLVACLRAESVLSPSSAEEQTYVATGNPASPALRMSKYFLEQISKNFARHV
jgi:hypothetical protein